MGKNKKPKEVVLLQWQYDDHHTLGGILKEKKNKFLAPQLFKSKADVNKVNERLKKEQQTGSLKIKKKRDYDFPIGLQKVFEYYNQSCPKPKLGTQTIKEFQKMIQTKGEDSQRRSVLQLVSVILSSYLIQAVSEIKNDLDFYPLDQNDIRALYVMISESENTFYALEKICQLVIVLTAGKDKKSCFRMNLPTIIPGNGEREISEVAYLKVYGYKKYKWPAPYRDMSVLLDHRFLGQKDIQDFSRLNPWCTCIIYGSKVKLPFGYHVDIKGNSLCDIELNWDSHQIYDLVQRYVASIPALFAENAYGFQKIWYQAGTYLNRYADAHKNQKIQPAERFKLRLMAAAMISFLDFAQQTCSDQELDIGEFREQILNVLLPGCIPKTDNIAAPPKSPQMVFEQVLQAILTEENLKHLYPIPDKYGSLWMDKTADGNNVWGYIKWYEWSVGEKPVPCLVLLRNQLLNLVSNLMPQLDNFKNVLPGIAKEGIRPQYIHSTMNAKVKQSEGTSSKSISAYRLKISELPIQDTIKQKMLDMAVQ